MAQRIYVPFQLFNLRIVNMQHLWVPSNEYKGQKTQKPNYFATCILDRTQQNWWDEPTLAPAVQAYMELLNKSGYQWQHINNWPIKDGNMPPEPGKPPSEWAKNRWVIGGSSSNAIKVDIAQPNGNVGPLPQRVGVKPGDYVALGLSAAIKTNDAQGVKNYMNTLLFMSACPPDQEIAVGQGVTGEELANAARAAGLQVAGFQPSQGFPSGPQPGFIPPGGAPGPGPGFSPGNGGFAPTQPGPAPAPHANHPNGGAPNGSAYPSNPQNPAPAPSFQPQGAPGFNPGGAGQGMPQSGGPAYTPAGGAPAMSNGPTAQPSAYPSSPAPQMPQQQWAPPPNFAGPR
jgi:hypothetical protein